MSYSTPEDLRVRKNNLPSSTTDRDLQVFCDKATVYLNGMLAKAYTVPFSPIPPMIAQIADDLSLFLFVESMYTSQKPNLDEYYLRLKERTDKLLQDILNGDIALISENGNVQPLPTWNNGYATTNDDDPFFDRSHPYW